MRNFPAWIALASVLAFALGASLFSEPSDCFQYGNTKTTHQTARSNEEAPPPTATIDQEKAASKAAKAEYDCKPWWGPEWFLVWVSIPLATFTALLFASTRTIAIDTKKSSERQLRAYVSVKVGAGGNQGRTKFYRFQFQPIILNTGLTPAYKLRVVSDIRMLPHPIPKDYDFSLSNSGDKSVMTLGREQEFFTPVVMTTRLSLSQLKLIKTASPFRLCVYGTVRYEDAFEKEHFTNYCFAILFSDRKGPTTWNLTELHNNSD